MPAIFHGGIVYEHPVYKGGRKTLFYYTGTWRNPLVSFASPPPPPPPPEQSGTKLLWSLRLFGGQRGAYKTRFGRPRVLTFAPVFCALSGARTPKTLFFLLRLLFLEGFFFFLFLFCLQEEGIFSFFVNFFYPSVAPQQLVCCRKVFPLPYSIKYTYLCIYNRHHRSSGSFGLQIWNRTSECSPRTPIPRPAIRPSWNAIRPKDILNRPCPGTKTANPCRLTTKNGQSVYFINTLF